MNIHHLDSRLIITSRDNLLVVDVNTGDSHAVKIPPPQLPPNLSKGQLEVLNKEERTINAVTVSRNGQYIAVSTENKQIVIYNESLKLVKNFIVNRTASKVAFSSSGDILVADRTGDVFLYKFSEESRAPVLLLGHLSIILDLVFSDCGKYIVTCDRDEKIRISHFPNTYNIVSFCLGHEEFVTVIKVVKQLLVSASGDGTVRFWDFLKGEQLGIINTNQYVNDIKLLEVFSEEMDKEKVDVTALPISDMQVSLNGNSLHIAVSLFRYRGIQLYKTNINNCESTYLQTIWLKEAPFKFYLAHNLYVFSDSKLSVFKAVDDDYVETQFPELEAAIARYKDILKIVDCNLITVLYKRKFDNVQEYLERKKLRLESSK